MSTDDPASATIAASSKRYPRYQQLFSGRPPTLAGPLPASMHHELRSHLNYLTASVAQAVRGAAALCDRRKWKIGFVWSRRTRTMEGFAALAPEAVPPCRRDPAH